MTDLSVPFAWTQGMRPHSSRTRSKAQPWQEVLWRRLTGRLGGLRSGDTTLDSERILDIGRNVYYYIGACHPDFGLYVATYGEHVPDAVDATAISPFDTGGIAQGHTLWTSTLTPEVLVKRETYEVGDYQARFEGWLAAAYAARDDYPSLHRPSFASCPEIDLERAGDDGRAWMWEGRVASHDLPSAPLVLTGVFFQSGRRLRYRDWIKEEAPMSPGEAKDHLAVIASVGRETADPVRDARLSILGRTP